MAQTCGPWSNVQTINVQAQIPSVAGIAAQATSPTTATISWQAAQGLTGTVQYALRHVDATGAVVKTNMGNVAPQVTLSGTSISLSSLTAGDALHFEVAVVAGGQTGPWSTVQTLQMPQATSGGGASYPPTVNAQCQSLLQEETGVMNTIRSLQTTLANEKAAWNNTFMTFVGTPTQKAAALATIQTQINATQNQINTATTNLQNISNQMHAAGCF